MITRRLPLIAAILVLNSIIEWANPSLAAARLNPDRAVLALLRHSLKQREELILYDTSSRQVIPIATSEKETYSPKAWSPKGSWLLYTSEEGFFLYHHRGRLSIMVPLPVSPEQNWKAWIYQFDPNEKWLTLGTGREVFLVALDPLLNPTKKIPLPSSCPKVQEVQWISSSTLFLLCGEEVSKPSKSIRFHVDTGESEEQSIVTRPGDFIGIRNNGQLVFETVGREQGHFEHKIISMNEKGKSAVLITKANLPEDDEALIQYLPKRNYFLFVIPTEDEGDKAELTLVRPGKKAMAWLRQFREVYNLNPSQNEQWMAMTTSQSIEERPWGNIYLIQIDTQKTKLLLPANRRFSYSNPLIRP